MSSQYPPPSILVIRPSTDTHRRVVAQVGAALAVPLAFVAIEMVLIGSVVGRLAFGIFLLVVIGVASSATWHYLRTAQVAVSSAQVVARGAFGRVRRFGADQVGVAVEIAGLVPGSARPPVPQLVLIGRDGRRLLRLSGGLWGTAALAQIGGVLGAPIDRVGVLTPKQLRQRHPGAASWIEVHPVAAGLLGALAAVVVLVVVCILLFAS